MQFYKHGMVTIALLELPVLAEIIRPDCELIALQRRTHGALSFLVGDEVQPDEQIHILRDPGKAGKVRLQGWLLIVIGLGLCGGMATIASSIHAVILHQNEPGSTSHWHGGPEMTRTAFELFGARFAFGLFALANSDHRRASEGSGQLRDGRAKVAAQAQGYWDACCW